MQEENNYSSKRIAKNTLVLYVRMIFMMLISLYTSRVVLNTLGVEDFGVYNVVGGLVSVFSILTTSLANAISRYITFALGENNLEKSKKVYSIAIVIQLIMAIIIGLCIEIIGSWFLFHKLSIPDGRMQAAFWVMQFSIVGFCVGLISIPYNAEIMAHEKMSVYAYFSILEAILKLLIVFLLLLSPFDKLISYAALGLAIAILMRSIYAIYCKRNFEECDFHFVYDKALFKEIGGFAGWNFFGEAVWILSTQGMNILVNTFFGVTLNAARGIADQVNGTINKFSGSFMTALTPQITKTYATKEYQALHTLVLSGTKLSYVLMLFLALPIFLETPILLRLWLKIVPEYAVVFTRLSIISSLIIILGSNLVKAQFATGQIKRYQIIISACGIWVLPITWICFHMGMPPEWSYHIFNIIWFCLIFVRIYLVKDLIQLPWKKYCVDVLGRLALTSILAFIPPFLFCHFLQESALRLFLVIIASSLSILVFSYSIGCNTSEKETIYRYIKTRINRTGRSA